MPPEGPSQPPPLPESEIQKKLEKSEGLTFIPSEFHAEIPETYDHQIGEDLRLGEDYASKMIREAVRYINLPIVIDPFISGEDEERTAWKKKIISVYGDEGYAYISSNKLRNNKISNVIQFLSFFTQNSRRYNVRTPKIEAMIDIHKRLNDAYAGYREKKLEDQIEVTKKISELCLEIIGLLSQES